MKRSAVMIGLGVMLGAGCGAPGGEALDQSQDAIANPVSQGHQFFNKTQFGGNGRTCSSCHPSEAGQSGTISPADLQARYAANPSDPIFQADAADVGSPGTFTRFLRDATVQITIPLPANIRIVGSDARTVTLFRGTPTTMNTPALDPVLMQDGREPSLQSQARDAIHDHAQSSDVSQNQLNAIAAFEATLFNRPALAAYAAGGPPPQLPAGTTASEIRGRAFFDPASPAHIVCTGCHGGPMLDTVQPENQQIGDPNPPGARVDTIFVSEINKAGNPVYLWELTKPDGTTLQFPSPDPGRVLIDGDPNHINTFKIPTLWGVKDTAPYFHDNSAKTLEEVMDHYDMVFRQRGLFLSAQDKADIVAYMKLL